jgi:hypothetical protein
MPFMHKNTSLLFSSCPGQLRNFILRAEPDLKQGIVFTPEQRQRQRELTRQILRELKEQRE